jgi:hypothetical protein
MTVKFHLLDGYGEIPTPLRRSIKRELQDALVTVSTHLTLDRLDVLVLPGKWVIPEYGLTGRTEGKGRVTITVDPESAHLRDPECPARLLGVLAHELHHVVRTRGPGYGMTLHESLVSEGLAQCFEEEVGLPPPFYAVFLDAATLARVDAKAKEASPLLRYDHNAWYFGRFGDAEWPRYAGYSLGYAIVKAWLDENGVTAAASATVPANDIIGPWKDGALDIRHPTR